MFVKSSFPQRKIDLQTELQATAVSVTLDKEITICSVYIPPSFSLNSQHLDSLLQQLPSPYIILGDFNGHNILWGGKNNDSRGELIENFLTKNDICIMNDKSYTYLSTSAKSFSAPFTVRHFLLECGDFAQVRNNCFHVNNMKELFQDIHIDSIMTFLRQINLFNKI